MSETIGFIENTFDELYPGNVFNFFFMDERFDRQYSNDRQFGKVFNLFSFLAIIISCLGLFGLAGYTVIKRTKEIGIRKVLGATSWNVLSIISVDFFKLIIIASLVAIPMVYLGAREWLASYAFHVPMSIMFFLVPILIVLAIAVATVSFHTLKSASKNPVESLRHE